MKINKQEKFVYLCIRCYRKFVKTIWWIRNKACDVLIAFDESLYDHHDGNMTYLANLAKDHLKVQIYSAVYTNILPLLKFTGLAS